MSKYEKNLNIRISEEQLKKLKAHCEETYMTWNSYIRLILDIGCENLKGIQKNEKE